MQSDGMTPARILSVCVGISAYRPAVLEPGGRPPRFLADSARDLSRAFAALWPGHGSKHVLVVDEAATLASVGSLIAAATDRYDCLLLYMGGHGRIVRNSFEFLFAGDEPVSASGSARVIDALAAIAKADNVVLFLDCCCAGKYGEETTYFRSTIPGGMRVCIASAAKNQRNLEDPRFRRSLFVDAIIKALAVDNGPDRLAGGDAGGLYRVIAVEVSRHASALGNGEAQEPLLIGSARAVPVLPADRRRTGSARTKPADKLLLRRRLRIALAALAVIAASVAGLSVTTWHAAINDDGFVELRAGPEWLSHLMLGPLHPRVETDATSADLRSGAVASGHGPLMMNEGGMHLWAGMNAAQVRRWADVVVEGYLTAEAGARWRVRLGYDDAVRRLPGEPGPGEDGVRPVDARAGLAEAVDATGLAAEARILDPSRPLADVWRPQWRALVVPASCADAEPSAEVRQGLLRYLHRTDPGRYAGWLRGLALTARVDQAVGIEEVARLVEMFAAAHALGLGERLAATADPAASVADTGLAGPPAERPTIDEVAALAAIAAAVMARKTAGSHETVVPSERARITGILAGCGDVAMPVLAALGRHGDPARVVAWARARPASSFARYSLRELAAHGALPGDEIMRQLQAQGFFADREDRVRAFIAAREWLLALSDVMPLPPDVLVLLVTFAGERLSADDVDGARQALAIALRSPIAAQPPLAADISRLMERIVPPRLPRKMPAKNVLPIHQGDLELLGLLARSGAALSDEQRKLVVNVLERGDYRGIPHVHYSGSDAGGSPQATQIAIVVNSAHLLALSRFILGVQAEDKIADNPRTLNFLRQAIADAIRSGVPLERIRDAVTAAALLRNKRANHALDAAKIGSELRRLAADATARQAEVAIAKAALSFMPAPQADRVVADLRIEWRRAREPEAKLALAGLIIAATADR
jgi:hypothetical protein